MKAKEIIFIPLFLCVLVFYSGCEKTADTSFSKNSRKRALLEQGETEAAEALEETETEDISSVVPGDMRAPLPEELRNREGYGLIEENRFLATVNAPLSTFSIDVDAASYANMRRFLNQGQLPPKDAIRIEEMVNYFDYTYPQPTGGDPFSVTTEVSGCPWDKSHQLIHIGLQGQKIDLDELPPSNLVFLVDVSGSMQNANKLPLLKQAFQLLINELRPQDRVSIVTYAGNAGLVLPSTSGAEKEKIIMALNHLEAGGGTAGAEGIELAYQIAAQNFYKKGNNRVLIATDGDFNVGMSSDAALTRLIEAKREQGIFLTVLGFGMGNYQDAKMQKLADKGNGNHAYIDNLLEAEKVFVREFGGTLFTIAKDVKIQVEFNPKKVKGYRLIGYENRMLAAEDFNDDKKDAGELGAGHTVTALYEIIPAVSKEKIAVVDPLKYQQSRQERPQYADELLTLKLRYKSPQGNTSKKITTTVPATLTPPIATSDNFRFSAAVASFGLLLRDSQYKGNSSYDSIFKLAKAALGEDEKGYRSEFLSLVKKAQSLSTSAISFEE